MTPLQLPTARIRAAIDSGDWTGASDLLADHQRELTAALASVDLKSVPTEPWLDLLLAQRALIDELRVARDQVQHALGKLSQDHRGARAYLRNVG